MMKASVTAVILFSSFVGVIGFAFYHHVMMLEYDNNMQHIIPDAHNLTYKSYDVQYWNYVPGIVFTIRRYIFGR